MSTVDWNPIRSDYLHDPTLTHTQLAKKHSVSIGMIVKRAKEENWTMKRAEINARAIEKTVENASDILVEVNDRHTRTYKNMQALGLLELNIALDNIAEAKEEAAIEGSKVAFDNKKVMGQQRLKFLFDALKIAMDGERITLNLPTSVSVSKNESTNKNDGELFEQVDMNELAGAITKAVAGLAEGPTSGNST